MARRTSIGRRKGRDHLVYEVVRRARKGESQRHIAQELGIARETVKKILTKQEMRREHGESAIDRELPKKRAPRGSKLDPYKAKIDRWLEEYKKPPITAHRVHEKLSAEITLGYTTVREYVQEKRAETKKTTAVQVVRTAPGHQAQFDYSPYVIEDRSTVQLWSCTLAWSRGRSFQANDNYKQTTTFQCLTQSFEDFGGVPDECVTDSMPGVVDRWECDSPILNARFVDYAAYYGFAVHIAPRGRGDYKGKVERPFRYVENNLFSGRKFYCLEQFRETLAWWTENRALKRPHPVTKKPIFEMMAEERPHLNPLPRKPYDARDVVFRLVEETAFIQYEKNFYAVPEEHIGTVVYVCVGAERVEIVDRGVHALVEYERFADGAGKWTDPHPKNRKRFRHDVELLIQRMAAWGPSAEVFARTLKNKKRGPGRDLCAILSLQITWSAEHIVKAMNHAKNYDAYDAKAIKRILEAQFPARTLQDEIADRAREQIQRAMQAHPVGSRDVTSYSSLYPEAKKSNGQDH